MAELSLGKIASLVVQTNQRLDQISRVNGDATWWTKQIFIDLSEMLGTVSGTGGPRQELCEALVSQVRILVGRYEANAAMLDDIAENLRKLRETIK